MVVDNGNLGVIELHNGASLLIDNTQSGGVVRSAAIQASGGAQVTVIGPKDLFISELQTDGSSVALLNGGDIERGAIAFGGSVKVTHGAVIRTGLEARNAATVEMDAGTVFGAIDLYDRSLLAMTGGTVNGSVVGHDRSRLSIGRGQMDQVRTEQESTLGFSVTATARKLHASGTGGIVMSGGTVTTDVEGTDRTTVRLTGLANVVGNVIVDENVRLEVNGGQVQKNLVAKDFSQVFMDGGRIAGSVLLANTVTFGWAGGTIGGTIGPLPGPGLLDTDDGAVAVAVAAAAAPPPDPLTILISADDAATINIYGTELQSELIDPDYQGLYSLYRLTGTLADGEAIGEGAYFAVHNGTGASHHLLPPSAIPEPGGMPLVVVLGVVLLFASIRRRIRPGTGFSAGGPKGCRKGVPVMIFGISSGAGDGPCLSSAPRPTAAQSVIRCRHRETPRPLPAQRRHLPVSAAMRDVVLCGSRPARRRRRVDRRLQAQPPSTSRRDPVLSQRPPGPNPAPFVRPGPAISE
jgi:hypothetical protein